jgi:hypothetical protein
MVVTRKTVTFLNAGLVTWYNASQIGADPNNSPDEIELLVPGYRRVVYDRRAADVEDQVWAWARRVPFSFACVQKMRR